MNLNGKRLRLSPAKTDQVCFSTSLPSWCHSLQNARAVHDKWIIGTTVCQKFVEDIIDEYCRSLPCDFVKAHPSAIEHKRVKNCEKTRILWQLKDIPYDGTPFSVASHSVLKCSFSMTYNSKKNGKLDHGNGALDAKERRSSQENCQTNKSCHAKIIIKKIKRYEHFSLPLSASKQDRLTMLKKLKTELEVEGMVSGTREIFWLRLPLSVVHNHNFRGRSRIIHPSLRGKIKELLFNGITCPHRLKLELNNYVQKHFQDSLTPPAYDDEAYYPSLKSIKDVVYNYKIRNKGISSASNVGATRERKSETGGESIEIAEPNSGKVNTLQDLVQAYCTDSVRDEREVLPNTETDTTLLKRKIEAKLYYITKMSRSINDPKRLTEMLDYLNAFPGTKEYVYPEFVSRLQPTSDVVMVDNTNNWLHPVVDYQISNVPSHAYQNDFHSMTLNADINHLPTIQTSDIIVKDSFTVLNAPTIVKHSFYENTEIGNY